MLAGADWGQYGQAAARALVLFFLNPVVYIATLLLLWDSFRRSSAQKSFFGFHVHGTWRPLLVLSAQSLLTGVCLSIVYVVAGVVITPSEIWIVSGISCLFGLLRLRFASSLYAIGFFMVLSMVARLVPDTSSIHGLHWFMTTLTNASALNWVVVAAGLALAEGVFFVFRKSAVGPALVNSRRGRAIGAMVVQSSGLVPVLLLQPGAVHVHLYPGWPVSVNGMSGLSLVAMPLLFGFNGILTSLTPQRVYALYRNYNVLLGVVLAGDAVLVYEYSPLFAILGAVAILGIREALAWHVRSADSEGDARYPVSQDGVRVLGVLPNSIADAMGLAPGEVITRVNQVAVHSSYDLHFALNQNPAYARLEVVDVQGELRIVGKPVYTGERSKLGLILLPDSTDCKVYAQGRFGWLQSLYLRRVPLPGGFGNLWSEGDSPSVTE